MFPETNVNLGKLSKRLRKELLANPKQAAVLGVVCLVAIWFWMPLLWKSSGRKPAAAKAIAATGNDAPAANQPTTTSAKPEPTFTWMQLQAWRQADRLTRSAELPLESREVFRSPKQIEVVVTASETNDDEQPSREPIAEQTVDVEKLTLVLESIVYGGGRRRALINGQAVQENEEFNLSEKSGSSEAPTAKLMGKVTSITPSEVVVEVAGRPMRLKLQPKLLNRGEVIERTKVVN